MIVSYDDGGLGIERLEVASAQPPQQDDKTCEKEADYDHLYRRKLKQAEVKE